MQPKKKIQTIELDQECPSCGGTGVYVGMAERDGYAVECRTCKGKGEYHFTHTYVPFTGRKDLDGVKIVVEVNPGIMLGKDEKGRDLDFGGIPYEDWKNGAPFERSEMRNYSCPAWWYQLADYKQKPQWRKCIGVGVFADCRHFGEKHVCWKQFDYEKQMGEI